MERKKGFLALLCALALSMPMVSAGAQTSKETETAARASVRARDFSNFLLRYCNNCSFHDIREYQLRRACRRDINDIKSEMPKLIQDSAYFASEIVKGAGIINDLYPDEAHSNEAFAAYILISAYKDGYPSKDSPEYKMGRNMYEYEEVLKKLKLARYALKMNQK